VSIGLNVYNPPKVIRQDAIYKMGGENTALAHHQLILFGFGMTQCRE
jgi:hypothetical protein